MSLRILSAVTTAVILLAACSKGEKGTAVGDSSQAASTPSTSTPPGSPATPAPGHKVIVVQLVSDEKGSLFDPKEIEAKKGDVIRFTVKIGVHNIHFLPDSNTIKTGLPPASDMLQLPGQTYDVPVNFEPGTYYFQCDPHVALGMKGHLKVED